jgi:hypothetical protein
MASEQRSIELSVDYRIWAILIQNAWSIPVAGMSMAILATDPVTSDVMPANTYQSSDGMPWCFLNNNGDVDISSIKVYDNGQALDPSSYYIQHRNGRVVLNNSPVGAVTADALVSAVHVVEGYPDNEWLTKHNLPAVAWFNPVTAGESFSIGTILEDRASFFTIDILANNPGELSDLMNDISRFIVKTPWIDMSEVPLFSTNGSVNPNFSVENQIIDYFRFPPKRRPRSEKIPPRIGGLEKERHRGVITLSLQHIS